MRTNLNGLIATNLTSLSLLLNASTSFAQGLVVFANGPSELISYGPIASESALPANEAGAFYFALLISTNDTGPFTFTGVYATNSATAGTIGPSSYVPAVPGWPAPVWMYYEVAGWSSQLGAVWNPRWLVNNVPAPAGDAIWSTASTNSYFGISTIAQAAAGGGAPPGDWIPPLFGGTGLRGFNLAPVGGKGHISTAISGGNIAVSWTPPGGTLQATPTLGPGATWSTVGTQNPTNIALSSSSLFFRVGP